MHEIIIFKHDLFHRAQRLPIEDIKGTDMRDYEMLRKADKVTLLDNGQSVVLKDRFGSPPIPHDDLYLSPWVKQEHPDTEKPDLFDIASSMEKVKQTDMIISMSRNKGKTYMHNLLIDQYKNTKIYLKPEQAKVFLEEALHYS